MIARGCFSHLRIANLPANAKSALPRLQSWPVFGKGKKASEAQEERIKNRDGAISLISSHEFWTNLSKYHRNQPIQNITKIICHTCKNIVAKIIIMKKYHKRRDRCVLLGILCTGIPCLFCYSPAQRADIINRDQKQKNRTL